MRTVLLTMGVPSQSSGSGGSQTTATIATALAERGHDVTVCSIVVPEYVDPAGTAWRQQLRAAEDLGLRVRCVVSEAWNPEQRPHMSRFRALANPLEEALVPTLRDAAAVAETVGELDPDCVLVYNWDALAASGKIRAPRFGAMSDPSHLPPVYRALEDWRESPRPVRVARDLARLQARLRREPALLRKLLAQCEAAGAFGAQHADRLRRHGLACPYYATPIPDPGREATASVEQDGPPRVLLMGHLRGIATRAGFRLLEQIVPRLERMLGAGAFELRIVGGYEPSAQQDRLLAHPSVRFLGYVPQIEDELRTAAVLLVPIPIKLGVRVRILTGWSYARPIVAHASNAAGIPELADGQNALLGRSADELAQATADALRDGERRAQLGAAGRLTFEQHFAAPVAVARLAETLERIASPRRAEAGARV
jgi:glycosyltransferase involved in cell wall biosynthesis